MRSLISTIKRWPSDCKRNVYVRERDYVGRRQKVGGEKNGVVSLDSCVRSLHTACACGWIQQDGSRLAACQQPSPLVQSMHV